MPHFVEVANPTYCAIELSFRGKGAEARVETRVKRASGKITLLPANVNVAV